jgi:predicted dehydrogenase
MVSETELDGVVIAGTPNTHYDQARYALEHGLHVLMEKPFVFHTAEAVELADIARAKGLLLSVCHPALYSPEMAEARALIRRGAIGTIRMVSGVFSQRVIDLLRGDVGAMFKAGNRYDVAPNASSYSDPSVSGGGEGHTQASHIIGMILWLTDLTPQTVFAFMSRMESGLDVSDAVSVQFDGGAVGTVAANGDLPQGVGAKQLQIQGDAGVIGMDTPTGALYHYASQEEGPRRLRSAPTPYADCVGDVPKNFVRAILGKEELRVGTEVAVNEVGLLDAAYRSAASGRPEAAFPAGTPVQRSTK